MNEQAPVPQISVQREFPLQSTVHVVAWRQSTVQVEPPEQFTVDEPEAVTSQLLPPLQLIVQIGVPPHPS